MLFKTRYYFDEHTFTYEKALLSRKDLLRRLGYMFLCGAAFAGLFLAVSLTYFGNLEERMLRAEQAELQAVLGRQLNQFADLEAHVDRLHQKDNTFYRSILSTDRIDAAQWQGGVGGAEVADTRLEEIRQSRLMILRLQHKTATLDASFSQLITLATAKKAELRRMPAIRPTSGRMLSGFGWRANPFHGGSEMHQGLDFAAPIGTPVYATGDGVVITAGDTERGYGNQVEIDHGTGIVTKYAHLSRVKVSRGDTVTRHQLIGLVGSTGYSTGPHLHYEVIRNGKKINPIDYFYNN